MSLDGVTQDGEEDVTNPLMSPIEEYSAKVSGIPNETIENWFKQLQEQDDISAEANSKRGAIRAEAKKMGLESADLNAAYARWKMDPTKRDKRDVAMAKCNEAMDIKYQEPLFTDGQPTKQH